MRRLILAALVLAVLTGGALGDSGAGLRAFDAEDYATAYRELLPAAEAGEPKAQYVLGLIFDAGLGRDKDPAGAVKWVEKAATQGHEEAQRTLGIFYEEGKGVARDYRAAAHWYRLAADQGKDRKSVV